jgi:hypothetical protein
MNEAPMKIWLDSEGAAWEHYSEEDTPYIRADIVYELVEALEKGMGFNEAYWKLINFSPSDTGLIKELTDKARAVLKKLEEE